MPKYIEKLTPAQEAKIPEYRDYWISVGLKTGATDWGTFDKYMPVCYKKAKLEYPKNIVRVQSPLVGALAAATAENILKKRRDAVDGAVRDAVAGAVDGAVGGAVGGAVDGAVADAVRPYWHFWIGGQFWVGGWYWGVAYVNYFLDICGLNISKDLTERAYAYRKVCESVNYIWPNRDFVMVCARPVHIDRDERGRLHSTERKAIMYPDGWGLYQLNGVAFEKKLWEKVVKKQLSFKEILNLKNIEQRMAALKVFGTETLLKEANAELLDKSEKGNELYLVKGVYPVDAYFLKYKDPSTDRVYCSGIDPEVGKSKDADIAMAWKFGITKTEYQNIIAEA